MIGKREQKYIWKNNLSRNKLPWQITECTLDPIRNDTLWRTKLWDWLPSSGHRCCDSRQINRALYTHLPTILHSADLFRFTISTSYRDVIVSRESYRGYVNRASLLFVFVFRGRDVLVMNNYSTMEYSQQ